MSVQEKYFEQFRKNIVGIDQQFVTPYGIQTIIYNDWLASGRLYKPIEEKLSETFGPYVANTHTETNETGTVMTYAYHHARKIIKEHVNASKQDVLLFGGYGTTGALNKFQRILGLKFNAALFDKKQLPEEERPVVFVTHMEHHSNHISWYETIADVIILAPDSQLLVDPEELRRQLEKYQHRKLKIGAFTACSNITGIITPYHELAKIMHEHNGCCFVDFAASAPYVRIDMNPPDPLKKLDAIFFSPHKFLGGPGSSGVLLFNSSLYHNNAPDNPGGGTVEWTNRWHEYKYIDDIESREDGGTPGFLLAIKTALAIKLKEQMGLENIRIREHELLKLALTEMKETAGIHIFAADAPERIAVVSFYHDTIHYNQIAKLLNDRYGIQVRGGCICAGTYGHFLMNISWNESHEITCRINDGDKSAKPGWIRFSMHPTTSNAEVMHFVRALKEIVANIDQWKQDYFYDKHSNEYRHKNDDGQKMISIGKYFEPAELTKKENREDDVMD